MTGNYIRALRAARARWAQVFCGGLGLLLCSWLALDDAPPTTGAAGVGYEEPAPRLSVTVSKHENTLRFVIAGEEAHSFEIGHIVVRTMTDQSRARFDFGPGEISSQDGSYEVSTSEGFAQAVSVGRGFGRASLFGTIGHRAIDVPLEGTFSIGEDGGDGEVVNVATAAPNAELDLADPDPEGLADMEETR